VGKILQRVSSFQKENAHLFRVSNRKVGVKKCPLSSFHFLDPQHERETPKKKQITTPTTTPTLLYTSLLSRDDDDKEEEY
jgi:hypothetical protein|tara:strand:- start:1064 stop:1303 length:240 start_codon:yes stop_codon:yes gene_type:complete